jgi:hypothetical protein
MTRAKREQCRVFEPEPGLFARKLIDGSDAHVTRLWPKVSSSPEPPTERPWSFRRRGGGVSRRSPCSIRIQRFGITDYGPRNA